MAKVVIQLLLLYFFMLPDTSIAKVCTPSLGDDLTAPKFPQMPSRWKSVVEEMPMSDSPLFRLPDLKTYNVDWKEKKISVIDGKSSQYSQVIYDYSDGKRVTVRGKSCTSTKGQFNPFGPFPPNASSTLDINDLLYLRKKYNVVFSSVVNGSDDGTSFEAWNGCIDEPNISLRTQYLFAREEPRKLISFLINGYANVSGDNVTVPATIFSFKNIQPVTGDLTQALYPPPDVYCGVFSGASCKFPDIPREFEMNTETIMGGKYSKLAFNTREYYDVNEKLHRSDHIANNSQGRFVPFHEIHDFSTGIAYHIESRTSRCSMSPIQDNSYDSDDADDHHHIRMKTSAEFFGISGNMYECKGVDAVRGIPATVITGKQRDERIFANKTIIRTWYFSKPDWKVIGIEGPTNTTTVPLKSIIYVNNITYTIHFFNFDPVEPTSHILWLLRYCYVNNRHFMYFRIDSLYDDIATKQKVVITALRDALASVGKISKLRVSAISTYKSCHGGVIAVRLYVFGTPAVKGSIKVLNPRHSTPLKDAVKRIKTAIINGKLVLNVRQMGKTPSVVNMKIQPNSYYDNPMNCPDPVPTQSPKTSLSKSGVSGGAVAGIALVLFFIAIVLTVAGIHCVLKRRGVQLFQHARFSNEPLT